MAEALETLRDIKLVVGERVPSDVTLHAADVVISLGGNVTKQRGGNRENTVRLEELPVIRRDPDDTIYYATGGISGPRVAVLKGDVVVDYIPKCSYPTQRQ